MSPDDLETLIKSMQMKDSQTPPTTAPGKTKRYNAVPPPPLKPNPWTNKSNTSNTRSPRKNRRASQSQGSQLPLDRTQTGTATDSPLTSPHNASAKSRNRQPAKPKPGSKNAPANALRTPKVFVPESTSPVSNERQLYVVIIETYNDSMRRDIDILYGVFSSLEHATAAVRELGATRPFRAGINGVREYQLRNAKVKVLPQELKGMDERHGKRESSSSEPLPTSDAESAAAKIEGEEETVPMPGYRAVMEGDIVYLALDSAPSGGHLYCIGVFATKVQAWAACLKYRDQLSYCGTAPLKEKSEWTDRSGMPHSQGKIEGGGWHHWFVDCYELDEVAKPVERKMGPVGRDSRTERSLDQRLDNVEATLRRLDLLDIS